VGASNAYSVQSNRFSEIEKVTASQDDGFVEEVENIWLGVQKHGKIEKLTGLPEKYQSPSDHKSSAASRNPMSEDSRVIIRRSRARPFPVQPHRRPGVLPLGSP
jgi:hypothetical protein